MLDLCARNSHERYRAPVMDSQYGCLRQQSERTPRQQSSRERKEPRATGDAAAADAAADCGLRSLASGLAAGDDEERGPSRQQIVCFLES